MKMKLSKCDHAEPIAATYYYDETTSMKKKKKKRSPKSKDDTCQICSETDTSCLKH